MSLSNSSANRTGTGNLSEEAITAYHIKQTINFVTGNILAPLICIPGALLAVVSLVLFLRHLSASRRQLEAERIRSLNTLLAGLTLFDLIFLLALFAVVTLCGDCLAYGGRVASKCGYCAAAVAMPLAATAQCCSAWTCVAISLDRYIAIKHPLKARFLCTPRRAKTALLVILVCSAVFRAPVWFEWRHMYTLRLSLRRSHAYTVYYRTYATLSIVGVVPIALLVALNASVYATVRRAVRARQQMTHAAYGRNRKARQPPQRADGDKAACCKDSAASKLHDGGDDPAAGSNGIRKDYITRKVSVQVKVNTSHDKHPNLHVKTFVMAFLVVISFLLFFMPTFINNVLEAVGYIPRTKITFILCMILSNASNLFLGINSAANFAIYCGTCRWFRMQLCQLLCHCTVRKQRADMSNVTLGMTTAHVNTPTNLTNMKRAQSAKMRQHRGNKQLLSYHQSIRQRKSTVPLNDSVATAACYNTLNATLAPAAACTPPLHDAVPHALGAPTGRHHAAMRRCSSAVTSRRPRIVAVHNDKTLVLRRPSVLLTRLSSKCHVEPPDDATNADGSENGSDAVQCHQCNIQAQILA